MTKNYDLATKVIKEILEGPCKDDINMKFAERLRKIDEEEVERELKEAEEWINTNAKRPKGSPDKGRSKFGAFRDVIYERKSP